MGRQSRVVGEADPQLSRETDVVAGRKRLTRLFARPLALTDNFVDPPCVRVAVCAESDNAKSAFVTAVAGTKEANRPLVCVLPPAVK